MKIPNINFLIYIKRLLKNSGIVLLLFCLPVLALIFGTYAKKAEGAQVGVYAKVPAQEVIDELLKSSDAITFNVYTDEEKMKNDVETQMLECAFVLPENVDDIENMQVICGEGYSSVLCEVAKEAVFAAVLKVYGDKAALGFAQKSNISITDENFKAAYFKYVETTPVSVAFEEAPSISEDEVPKRRNIPLSAAAIMLICAGLTGSAFYIRDKKRGVNFGAGRNIAAAILLFLVSAIAALHIWDAETDLLRLVVFCAGIWGGSRLFAAFVNNESVPWLVMPLVTLCVFLFDIVRISQIIPALGAVDNILLSHCLVYGDTVKLTGFSGVLCVLAYLKGYVFD
ncbi:MAG: hypothetical protein IJR59_00015 [Firmicutes bacterium]|nr:hypothetical protein [Bacillota bacterium]